jgi:hypothetical protein
MPYNSKPWWEKMAQLSTQAEKEQFLRGVGGASAQSGSGILFTIIAGYVGGRLAERKPGR